MMMMMIKVTSKKRAQNIQEIWDTMEIPNLKIIGIEESEHSQYKEPKKKKKSSTKSEKKKKSEKKEMP